MSNDRQQVKGMTKGQFGDAIQSLPTEMTNHYAVTIGVTTLNVDMTGAQLIRIASAVDAYINFGLSGVTADSGDLFFPAGVEILVMPKDMTHIAYIRESSDGPGSITQVGE